jgi:hypothetical protein
VNNIREETTMTIPLMVAAKPIVLLTLRTMRDSLVGFGGLLCQAAELRGQAVATTYLTAMGLSAGIPPRDCHRFRDTYSGSAAANSVAAGPAATGRWQPAGPR